MKEKPDYIIDFRESITPLSLLRMGQLVKQMKPHELLEIIVRDPEVRSDVLKIVPGCELIGMELNKEEDFCRMQLEKKDCSVNISFDHTGPPGFL
jgi:TusA-related sulfurtransferase